MPNTKELFDKLFSDDVIKEAIKQKLKEMGEVADVKMYPEEIYIYTCPYGHQQFGLLYYYKFRTARCPHCDRIYGFGEFAKKTYERKEVEGDGIN